MSPGTVLALRPAGPVNRAKPGTPRAEPGVPGPTPWTPHRRKEGVAQVHLQRLLGQTSTNAAAENHRDLFSCGSGGCKPRAVLLAGVGV